MLHKVIHYAPRQGLAAPHTFHIASGFLPGAGAVATVVGVGDAARHPGLRKNWLARKGGEEEDAVRRAEEHLDILHPDGDWEKRVEEGA